MFIIVLSALLTYAHAANRLCYGDLKLGKYQSSADPFNRLLMRLEVIQLLPYRHCFQQSADKNCIQASVIAAIAIKESKGGTTLVNGYGNGGKAWGIMQCDIARSGLPCTSVPWNSCAHIEMMVSRLLVPYIQIFDRDHPNWTQYQQVQGGIAAYKFGTENLQTLADLNVGTAGGDYSNYVLGRAKYLQSLGWD